MWFYCLIFGICTILFIISNSATIKGKKLEKVFEILFIVLLIIISGTRTIGGTDYFIYNSLYDRIPDVFKFSKYFFDGNIHYEMGYEFMCSLFKTLHFSFHSFTLIHSIIFYVLLYRFISKQKANHFFILIFFLYKMFLFDSMVYMRQSIAIVIFLNSIDYIKDKKIIKYLICCLLAILFHKTAYILIPLYFINKINFTRKTLFIYIFACFFAFILNITNLYIFNPGGILGQVFSNNEMIISKLSYYTSTANTINLLSTIEILIICLLILIFFEKSYKKLEFDKRIIVNLFLLLLPIVTLFRSFEVMIRVREYLNIFYPLVVTYLLTNLRSRDRFIMYLLIILVCFTGYYRYLYTFDNGRMIPYKSYLFNEE